MAVIGDSFIEGAGVRNEDLVTTVLARETGLTVVNLGQSFYGPQQELVVLRRYALPLRPSVIVWAFFEGNDLGDIHRYSRVVQNWHAFAAELHAFRKRTFTRNALLKVADLLRAAPYEAESRRHSVLLFRSSSGARRLYFFYGPGPLDEEDEEALALLGETLEEASRLCRDSSTRLVVVFIPTKLRVFYDFVQFAGDSAFTGVPMSTCRSFFHSSSTSMHLRPSSGTLPPT